MFSLKSLRRWLPPVLGLVLLAAALWVLHGELKAIHYRQLRRALELLPRSHVGWALAFTALNYFVLSCYDQLAFVYLRKRVSRWRIALAAFTGQAVSNNIGFSLLSGTSIRHRFYSRWGVKPSDLVRVMLFYSATFWVGLLALGGWTLAFRPPERLAAMAAPGIPQIVGGVLMALAAAYFLFSLIGSFRKQAPRLRVRGFELRLPGPHITLSQLLLSMADWALAAAVLHALLPIGGPSYPLVLGAFLSAQLLGLASFIPGGLGVFEGAFLVLLGTSISPVHALSALILFRIIYYVIPLILALAVLLVDEIRARRESLAQLGKFGRTLGITSIPLAPKALSVLVFLAGVLLLVSGATPAEQDRLRWLAKVFPLGIFEVSHFLGSLLGVGLLILSQAVARRLRLAYTFVLAGLAAGIAVSLLKGGDWEEALLLTLLLLFLIPTRGFFDRQAALFDTRFSRGWIFAITASVAASVWLGLFTYRHVEYSNDLWWQFALGHDAPRFLRASVGAAVLLAGFAGWRLFRPKPHSADPPTDADIADAARIIGAQSETMPFLVYLRDKTLLFNADRTAFIMYGVRGRTWAALGDPVGPDEAAPALIRAFIERADNYGGIPVFYQIHAAHLHRYADLGMTFAKLGEEGTVPLTAFTLEGGPNRDLRTACNRIGRENIAFRVAPAREVTSLLPRLREVSDSWLQGKAVAEKGFSLGSFDPDYLARLPVALEKDGRILAFANLLCGPTGEELSVDLMRFAADAPHGAMDGLFALIFLWGRDQGYRKFNMGMAPLSGLRASRRSPLWMRLGSFIYRHGEAFYNFEGLRAYKEKFHPVWAPRYLAYPGGPSLPVILADIAALSAGGYRKIFT